MATATDILARKGYSILHVPPSCTVLDAVHKMNQHGVGALVVLDEGQLLGMFTERDVLRRVVGECRDASTMPVGDVMTSDIHTCRPTDDIEDIATLMRNHRVRHVPICDEEGDLLGLVSIGDINAWNLNHQEAQIENLSNYIYGRA
jgi:CBS domain-containing protein